MSEENKETEKTSVGILNVIQILSSHLSGTIYPVLFSDQASFFTFSSLDRY